LPLSKFPEIVRSLSKDLFDINDLSEADLKLKHKIVEAFARSDCEESHLELVEYITSTDFLHKYFDKGEALNSQLDFIRFVISSMSEYSKPALNKLSANDVEKLYFAMCEGSTMFNAVANNDPELLYSLFKWRIRLLSVMMEFEDRY